MHHLSLTQLFGEGAFQDENSLLINKNSLEKLTPSPNNKPESLLAAMLLTALQNFQGVITDEDNEPITDENNQPIIFDNSDVYELLKIIRWNPFFIFRKNRSYINNQIIILSYDKHQ